MNVKKIIIIGIIAFIGLQLGTYILGQWQTGRKFARTISRIESHISESLEGVRAAKEAATGAQKSLRAVKETLEQQQQVIKRLEEANQQLYRDLQAGIKKQREEIDQLGNSIAGYQQALGKSGELIERGTAIVEGLIKTAHGSDN